jgi:hypothetical protein
LPRSALNMGMKSMRPGSGKRLQCLDAINYPMLAQQ